MDCIFCKIAEGAIPSYTVFENDNFKVILDAAPASKGHCLIIPKTHAADLFEMSEDMLAEAHIVSKKVAKAVKKAVAADGINIVQNNGAAAGQSVSHYHVHIIPRHTGDKIQLNVSGKGLSEFEFEEIRSSIASNIE